MVTNTNTNKKQTHPAPEAWVGKVVTVRQPDGPPALFYADRGYAGWPPRWSPKLVGWYLPGGPWAVPAERIERGATASDLTQAGLSAEDRAENHTENTLAVLEPEEDAEQEQHDPYAVLLGRATTRIGLDLDRLPPNMTPDDWSALGLPLAALKQGMQWAMGDWSIAMGKRYGATYATQRALTGLDYSTLTDYTYVALAFTFSVRNENVTWSVHKAIAPLCKIDLELALAYLRLADMERWTVAQARANVAAVLPAPPHESRGGGRKPRTQEDPERITISSVDGVAAALTIRARCSPEFIAVLVEALEGGTPMGSE